MPIRVPKPGRLLMKPPSVKFPKVKVGGFGDFAKRPEALGAAIGAGVLFGVQALANIKGKDGISAQQRMMRSRARHIQTDLDLKEEEGRPLGYSDRVKQITAKPYSQLADLAADYPLRSALKVGATGAMGGAAIARMLTKVATGPTLAGLPKPPPMPSATMPKSPGAAAAAPGLPKMQNMSAGMPKLAQELLDIGDEWGRELAKEAFAGSALFGQAARAITKSRWGGAGVGALAGAARYATSDDPNKSFVGSVGGGALAGGMAHQLAKGGLMAARKNQGAVGHFVRDSNRMAGKGERMLKANPKADISGIKGTEYVSAERKASEAAAKKSAYETKQKELLANKPGAAKPAVAEKPARYPGKPAPAGPDDHLTRMGAKPDQIAAMRKSGLSDQQIQQQIARTSPPPPMPVQAKAPPIRVGPPGTVPSPIVPMPQVMPTALAPPRPAAPVSPAAPPMAQPAVTGPVRPPGQPPAAPAAVSPMAPPIAQPQVEAYRNPQVPMQGARPTQRPAMQKNAAMRKVAARRLDILRSRSLARMMGDM